MKSLKRILLTFLIILAVAVLFRGEIFRSLVTYKTLGERSSFVINDQKLDSLIISDPKNIKEPGIHQIIETGLAITSRSLNFTIDKNEVDPNKLVYTKTAHCVGYATFFTIACNRLLEKHGLSEDWKAKPQIGQLHFLGINFHQYFSSPFFKDHDFVIIENIATGEVYAVDPTVSDYLGIDFIKHE